MQPISLTALRNNVFKIVDQVIQSGNPVLQDTHIAVWLYAGLIDKISKKWFSIYTE